MRTTWHDLAVAVGATDIFFVLTVILFVLRQLHRKPPKLMIVDEVHHLLAGSVREQRQSP